MVQRNILVDARQFIGGTSTGIGRYVEGLVDCLADTFAGDRIVLISFGENQIPSRLTTRNNITVNKISPSFLKSELTLSRLSRAGANLIISPYPKLPLFGTFCPCINTVHDVLDLTHPAYRKRSKVVFDTFRIKAALKRADVSWFDSESSLRAAQKLLGMVGRKPRVRYPAISEIFNPNHQENEEAVLNKYNLDKGYILTIGNGLPHKNLGILLEVSDRLARKLVFVGVCAQNKKLWLTDYPHADAVWTHPVDDQDLPAIIRGAYCLAQPSTAEGYGYPPLEAMACGVPAVVSKIPVLVETTGGAALTADPLNSEAWLNSFLNLENEEFHRRQVEKGLRWVKPFLGRRGWHKCLSDIQSVMRVKHLR